MNPIRQSFSTLSRVYHQDILRGTSPSAYSDGNTSCLYLTWTESQGIPLICVYFDRSVYSIAGTSLLHSWVFRETT